MVKYLRLFATLLPVVLVIQFAVIAVYGTSDDADRFGYWSAMPEALRGIVQGIRGLNVPILMAAGFLLAAVGRSRLFYFVILELLLLQVPLLLMGDKFSPFMSALLGCLAGVAVARALAGGRVRFKGRYAFWGVALLAAVLTSLVVGVSKMAAGANLGTTLFQRVVLQGHVWYGIVDRVQQDGAPLLTLNDLVQRDTLEHHTGLNALSLFVSDPHWVAARLERGIPFTMGGPAAPLALTGPMLGLVIFVVMGTILNVLQFKVIIEAARRGKLLTAGAGFLFSISVFSIMSMGNWYSFYNPASLILAAMLVLWALFPRAPFKATAPASLPAYRSSEAATAGR